MSLTPLCIHTHTYITTNMHSMRTVYPKKYAHGFVVLCFVMVMQSFIMNSHEVFIHIHQGCFAGTGAIVRLPQCQWSKPDGYGKISQCITTAKHSKAKTVCIFLGIYCISSSMTTMCVAFNFKLINDRNFITISTLLCWHNKRILTHIYCVNIQDYFYLIPDKIQLLILDNVFHIFMSLWSTTKKNK